MTLIRVDDMWTWWRETQRIRLFFFPTRRERAVPKLDMRRLYYSHMKAMSPWYIIPCHLYESRTLYECSSSK